MNIKDKSVVITGAGQGLGRCMAKSLAQRGARLALIDLNEDRLKETQELCRKVGVETRYYLTNVADESAVEQLFNRIAEDFGAVDALINNAGTNADGLLVKSKDGDITKMPLQDFEKVIAVDLTGVFLCAREAAVQMIKSAKGGVIINISSIAQSGNFGQSNYSAAKAGVSAMTVTWAKELARHQIRVAGIAPGFSETQMVGNMKSDIQDNIRKQIPLGRFGKPEEISHGAIFILENDYFHGRILEIDGGLRL